MDHRNLATTMKYIRMTDDTRQVVEKLHLPPVAGRKSPDAG